MTFPNVHLQIWCSGSILDITSKILKYCFLEKYNVYLFFGKRFFAFKFVKCYNCTLKIIIINLVEKNICPYQELNTDLEIGRPNKQKRNS